MRHHVHREDPVLVEGAGLVEGQDRRLGDGAHPEQICPVEVHIGAVADILPGRVGGWAAREVDPHHVIADEGAGGLREFLQPGPVPDGRRIEDPAELAPVRHVDIPPATGNRIEAALAAEGECS